MEDTLAAETVGSVDGGVLQPSPDLPKAPPKGKWDVLLLGLPLTPGRPRLAVGAQV